jgi:DNA-directed RNA polymerase subunit RPC12/RpoP
MAEARVTVEPVRCPGCGAAVAIADREEVSCPFCAAKVLVPAEHRAALRAANDADSARTTAQQLYAELGRRPGRILRACAFFFGTRVRIGLSFLLVSSVILLAEAALLFAVSILLRNNLVETQSGGPWIDLATMPLWTSLLLLVTVLAVHGRRVALDRQALQIALSAGPPARPGGPASCRECGGPLTIGPNDLGVRCLYCRTDNLVAVEPSWIASFRGQLLRAGKEIEEVERVAARGRAARRRTLWRHLGLVSIIIAAFFGFAAYMQSQEPPPAEHFPPFWSRNTGDPRPILRRYPSDVVEAIAMPPGCSVPPDYRPDECRGNRCTTRLHVALHDDDTILLHDRGPAQLEVDVLWHYFAGWPKESTGTFGHRIAHVALAPGESREVAADWSAWYQLAVTSNGGPMAAVGLCVEVR